MPSPPFFSIARYKEAWVKDNFIWRNGVVKWNVIFVRSIQDWELGMVLSFFDRLNSCKISFGNVDRIRWSSSKKGIFEVKSFYKALSNFDHEVFPWKISGVLTCRCEWRSSGGLRPSAKF